LEACSNVQHDFLFVNVQRVVHPPPIISLSVGGKFSLDMIPSKKLSIVIPVYNSQDCVEALVNRINEFLNGPDCEIILVNDCSPDKSWREIEKAVKLNNNVIGINLRKNAGQDNAIMAGLSEARGDYIVVMDDDLQHDPADIKTLVEALEKSDSDVCFARFPQKKQRLWKNLGSWFNGKMSEIMINKPRNIYLSPFKIIRKQIVDQIVKYHGPYPYLDGLIFTITANVTQIDVTHHDRYVGEGNYTLVKSINVWLKLMTSFSEFPLRIATFFGFIASTIGFLMAIFYFAKYFLVGEQVEGWTSLMVVTLILCGSILLALGAVGEYVGRSYILLNGRPQYTVKDLLLPNDSENDSPIALDRHLNTG
jgi:undecaprenyl-phosphate 4-deoxy-4-formamido-L-arabinose transferase